MKKDLYDAEFEKNISINPDRNILCVLDIEELSLKKTWERKMEKFSAIQLINLFALFCQRLMIWL